MLFRRFFLSIAASLSAALGCSVVSAINVPQLTNLTPTPAGTQQAVRLPLVDLKKRFDGHLQPASRATRELQSGYQKLTRMCGIGKPALPAQVASLLELPGKTAKARLELKAVEVNLQQVLKDYAQNSRITKLNACRFVPIFAPLSFTCDGFRQDRARLDLATEVAQNLLSEARQRLDLYEQFGQLEIRGCSRPGFSLKLWETEQTYLWSSLTDSPSFFRTLLPEAALD
jgi:hypothetical protein